MAWSVRPAAASDRSCWSSAVSGPSETAGVSGLAFHQSNGSDAAAVTYNTVNGVYGGNLWDSAEKQIEGVINEARWGSEH